MDAIRLYVQTHPEDRVILMGGAASYIWIKNKLGIDILLKDIDVHITTQANEEKVVNDFLHLLPGYDVKGEPEVISTLEGPGIPFDIFINQVPNIDHAIVNSIPVETVGSLIKDYEISINAMIDDLAYPHLRPEDREYLMDKIPRLEHRLEMLRKL